MFGATFLSIVAYLTQPVFQPESLHFTCCCQINLSEAIALITIPKLKYLKSSHCVDFKILCETHYKFKK